jgi:Fe2+ transport system protein FeoA
MEKCLKDFKPSESGIVKKLVADGKIKRRLFDMGVTPGAQVTMRKAAPLGDPIEINLRGYELTIRKDEAQAIFLEV